MDGTFKCCPNLFLQLYSIHGIVGYEGAQRIVPLVYGFLTRKTVECYVQFFRGLKDYASEFNIQLEAGHVMTDFELAAINAVKIEFPGSVHKGCFFHLGQILWRKIQENGLSAKYGEDNEFALKLRHLTALAFLEPSEIPDAFLLLKTNVLPPEAEFENNYVLGKCNPQQTPR